MTIIKNSEVPYLNEDVIEKYNNVIIISAEGLMLKMNAFMLCAMSHSLKLALLEFDDFQSDFMITTEFSLEELKQVKNYCTKGLSNAMTESIMNSFGLLRPFSICLKRQEKWNEKNQKKKHSAFYSLESKPINKDFDKSMINTVIPIKNEINDIKDEALENFEFDYNLEYASDDSFQPPVKEKTSRKSRQKRKKPIKDEDNELLEDLEFNVGSEYSTDDSFSLPSNKNKVRKKGAKRHNKNIKVDDNDWKPKKHKSQGKPSNNSMLHKQWSDNDLELFRKFELPKPLEEYVTKPKDIDAKKIEESINDEKKQFQCSECQLKFACKYNLDIHVIKCHNEHLPCPHCFSAFFVNDIENFKKHIFFHLNLSKNSDKFKACVQCGKNYNRANQIHKHLKQKGPLHNDECTQCSKKFSTFKEYQDHVNNQHYGVWKYRCGFENCGEMFDNDKKCIMHGRVTHRQKELKPNKEKTQTAKPKPSNEFVGICETCGFHYKTKATYNSHMYYHHNNKDRNKPCPVCNKIVLKPKVHMKAMHLETMCPHCGKMISGTTTLRNHIKSVHTSMKDRPLKCHTCEKRFFDKHTLEEHYNVHTGAKPFKCKYCPAAFGSNGTRRMHEKGHLGIKRKPKQ